MAARLEAPPPRCYATGRARLFPRTTTPRHPALEGLQLPACPTRRRQRARTTYPGRQRGQLPIGVADAAGCAAGGERGKRRGDISCRAAPGAAARAGPRMAALGGRCGAAGERPKRGGGPDERIGAFVLRGVWAKVQGGEEGVWACAGGEHRVRGFGGARAGRL